MLTTFCPPASPGVYTEWPILSGAPTAWQAALANDAAYIEAVALGQRQSFVVTLPPIAGDDTLVSAVIRGFAARPDDSGNFSDGGFEDGTWILATVCAVNGATINSVLANVRSGTKSLRINSRTVGPTCGQADKTVSGLTVGRTYQVNGFYKTASITTEKFEIRVDGAPIATLGSNSPGGFTAFGPASFVASATSHVITIYFNQMVGAGVHTYYFDDVTFGAAGDASMVPFYRVYGADYDLPAWSIPQGTTTPILQPERAITGVSAGAIRDGAFEVGVRNTGGAPVRLDQIELDLTLRSYRERFGFVGLPPRR